MKQNPGRVINTGILASMVGQAYPTAFTSVNILSGFKKTGIYPFNRSSVDDRQLAPSNAFSKKLLLLLQLLRQSSHFQKMNQVYQLLHVQIMRPRYLTTHLVPCLSLRRSLDGKGRLVSTKIQFVLLMMFLMV